MAQTIDFIRSHTVLLSDTGLYAIVVYILFVTIWYKHNNLIIYLFNNINGSIRIHISDGDGSSKLT